MINGKKCTVCWNVDDNKISHVDSKVVDDVIKLIESKFGEMTVNKGNTHTFVGMDFEVNKNGTVGTSMTEYISNV